MHSAVTIMGYSLGPVQADHSTDDPDNLLEPARRFYAREIVHIYMHMCAHISEKQLECYSELKISVTQVLRGPTPGCEVWVLDRFGYTKITFFFSKVFRNMKLSSYCNLKVP